MQSGRGVRCLASLLGNLHAGAYSMAAASTTAAATYDVGSATNIKWHEGMVSRSQKEQLLGQKVRQMPVHLAPCCCQTPFPA
jgi:hypothetical protein